MIDARKVKIAFEHKGAKCPQCGYVFENGFSSVGDAMEWTRHGGSWKGAMTACTGCNVALNVLEDGSVHALTRAEELMMGVDLSETRLYLAAYRAGLFAPKNKA